MKKLVMLGVLNSIFSINAQHATINFFIHEYPVEQLGRKLVTIDERTGPKYVMKKAFYQPANYGVYALYNGYLTHSDYYGLVSFPRKTQREQFMVLVSETIRPSFFIGSTIQHWHITDPKHATMYHVQRLQDPETELYYWRVLQSNLPEDYIVPIHTIIILAKPKNIYVPLGITPTTKQTNLILPPIYARKGLDHMAHALFVLKIKQFFNEVHPLTKTDTLTIDRLITTQTEQ